MVVVFRCGVEAGKRPMIARRSLMIGAVFSLAGSSALAQPQPADPANLLAYLMELEKGSWQYVKDKNIAGLQNYLADDALLLLGDGSRYSKTEVRQIVPAFKLESLA